MNRRDIVIGLVILALLVGVVYWRQTSKKEEEIKVPETLSVEDVLEEKFKLEIPEDVDKAELKDVSGGNASGLATRDFKDGQFSHTILADLPEPEAGKFYEGWLVKGEEGKEGFEAISTGRMRVAKGGYLLEYKSSKDLKDYTKVVVTLETKADKTPEKHILEGNF